MSVGKMIALGVAIAAFVLIILVLAGVAVELAGVMTLALIGALAVGVVVG